MEQKKVLIVDDDELVVMSLEMILEAEEDFEVVGKGYSGRDAISLYQKTKPDILLMDIRMSDINGLEAAEAILKEHRDARILFLTTFSDDEYIIKALSLGVKGYLLKQDYRSIASSLTAVLEGQNVFGGAVVEKLPSLLSGPKEEKTKNPYEAADISEKEYEIIQLVAKGMTNKEIAEKVFLSEGTVKNYISGILDKLELRDRTQLAVFYLSGS